MPLDAKQSFLQSVRRLIEMSVISARPEEIVPLFPQNVHIEVTNACNLDCIHCIQHSMRRKRGLMEFNVFRKVVDEIAPGNASITIDVQGEPLLHPKVFEFIAYAKEKGLFVSLLTNAVRMDEDASHRLLSLEVDRIVFSFDAVDKGLYERIRKGSCYEQTLLNILRFIKLNALSGEKTYITMSIIRQEATKGHIEDFMKYFKELPVNTVFVSDLLNMFGYSQVAGEVDLTDKCDLPREQWPICRIPWENITINWDGSVCPCPLDFEVSMNAGNVKDYSLEEIWNGEMYRRLRRAHLERNYSQVENGHAICSACNGLWFPEYNLRSYKKYAANTIFRLASQYGKTLSNDTGICENIDVEVRLKRVEERIKEHVAAFPEAIKRRFHA